MKRLGLLVLVLSLILTAHCFAQTDDNRTLDMAKWAADEIEAYAAVPEYIPIEHTQPSRTVCRTVSPAESMYMMASWLRYFRINRQEPSIIEIHLNFLSGPIVNRLNKIIPSR